MEKLPALSAVLESTKTPLELSVVRKRYTKLLQKRNTYQQYFEKNLKNVDLKLSKVLIRQSIQVQAPSLIFGDYKRGEGCPIIGKTPLKVVMRPGVLKERGSKEREILKKYATKVKVQREGVVKKRWEARFIREGATWAKRHFDRLEMQSVKQSLDVLAAAARATGLEEEPQVVELVGRQIRPPVDLTLGGWVNQVETVTVEETRFALRNLGIDKISFRPRPALPSSEGSGRRGERASVCPSCAFVGDGSPGECPRCEARMNVFTRRAPAPKKKRGSGRHMPR